VRRREAALNRQPLDQHEVQEGLGEGGCEGREEVSVISCAQRQNWEGRGDQVKRREEIFRMRTEKDEGEDEKI